MDEKPKSIWKKSFTGRTALVVWLAITVFTIMLGSFIIALTNQSRPMSETFMAWGIFAGGFLVVCLALIYVVWPLMRWLFWKHWRRTLFALACFATLIALFYAEENWRGKHDWEKLKREWEAKGEKFDYASVVPPPVPDEQNFAMQPIWVDSIKFEYGINVSKQWYGVTFTEAERTNLVDRLSLNITGNEGLVNSPTNRGYWAKVTETDLKSWQQYYRELAAKTNLFPIPPQPQTPAQDVLFALSKHDSAIEELRQASLLPYSRFPVFSNADHPFDTLLPHLSVFKRCAQFLQLRALAELQNGQSDQALEDVKLAIELTEKIRSEPFLISHLVRIAMTEISLQPIYEGLANHQWTDAQLIALDVELGRLDFLADYQLSLRGERVMNCATIDYINKEKSYQRYQAMSGLASGYYGGTTTSEQLKKTLKAAGAYLMPRGWFIQNKLFIAHGLQGWITGYVLPEAHLVLPEKYREVDQVQSGIFNQPSRPWNFMAKVFLPALGASGRKACREQISVDLARVAIALERYHLAHGEFPESLDALAPQFIAQVPHDIIGGKPLKYRREANGQFTLYSVGWNEKDDGGMTGYRKGGSAPDFESGDWVWRYPPK